MAKWHTCPECIGTGSIECSWCLGTGANLDNDRICRECSGDGEFDCEDCEGLGGYYKEEDEDED